MVTEPRSSGSEDSEVGMGGSLRFALGNAWRGKIREIYDSFNLGSFSFAQPRCCTAYRQSSCSSVACCDTFPVFEEADELVTTAAERLLVCQV